MQNDKKKNINQKNISDNITFWIGIIGFVLSVVSFFQNSSYKLLIIVVAISLCVVCTIVSLFRATKSAERAIFKEKRIEQIKKDVSEGKVPSDSYFFDNDAKDREYIIDTLYIEAHILYEEDAYEWGVEYTWKVECHLKNPDIFPKYFLSQIAGDYPIMDNDSLNVKAFIENSDMTCSMNVNIENVNHKTKNLCIIIPKGFFESKKNDFSYTLIYTWPRSYRPPEDKFSFFISKESNALTYETHIKVFGNKNCFTNACYEITDDEFNKCKVKLLTSKLEHDEIGVTLDIGKGSKEKMVYIETMI